MTVAQVDYWEGGGSGGYIALDYFYNVSYAVGPVGTAPNRREDVLLVQYFLKNIAGTVVVGPGWKRWEPPKTAQPLLVDGWMGSVTAAWIKSYQDSLKLLYKDGRVDRALGVWTSITQTMYTIVLLNHHFQNAQFEKFKSLEDDVDAPAELRSAIRLSRKRGAPAVPYQSPGLTR
jgi:hypothetical protein